MENINSQYLLNNNKFYKCYKDDIPYSCNGYGLNNDLCNLNNNCNFSVTCPKTWIKKPNSGWLSEIKNTEKNDKNYDTY